MFALISSVTGTQANDLRNENLQNAGQKIEYIQVEGAGHAFFDWKPDATTRSTFSQIGVKYADAMRTFFDSVFYKS